MPKIFSAGSKTKKHKKTYSIKKDNKTGYVSIIRKGLSNIPLLDMKKIFM